MSRTWGQIRYELTKGNPGVDLELLNGWIKSAYQEILDHRKWPLLEDQDADIVTVAPYRDGTVSLTNGSTTVTGTDTTFTSAMTGRRFRVTGRYEIYTFTYVGATSGTLDRNYEGDTDTEATYEIFKSVFSLESDVGVLNGVTNPYLGIDMTKYTSQRLDDEAAGRSTFGHSSVFVPLSKTTVELYPIPDAVYSYPYRFSPDPTEFSGSNTTASPLAWITDDAIIAGAQYRILRNAKDYAGADREESRFQRMLMQLSDKESRRAGPTPIRMEPQFTTHRRIRASR
jgi:hypothetical protein